MAGTILITRPSDQADNLITTLEQAGYSCVHQPMIDIVAKPDDDPALKQVIMNLDLYHYVISVSSNAAQLASEWIDQYWPQTPIGIQWLAVGPSSAQPLQGLGVCPSLPDIHNTEGLLQLPLLQPDAISGQKVLILRGEGGREALAETLSARGATVEYAELYKRQPIHLPTDTLTQICGQHHVQYVIATSGDILKGITTALSGSPLLNDLTFIVPSERVREIGTQQGVQHIHNSRGADAQSLLKTLQILVER